MESEIGQGSTKFFGTLGFLRMTADISHSKGVLHSLNYSLFPIRDLYNDSELEQQEVGTSSLLPLLAGGIPVTLVNLDDSELEENREVETYLDHREVDKTQKYLDEIGRSGLGHILLDIVKEQFCC
ncbi:hypothetical protein Tco_0564988 [Tanacetum coccineum]